MLALPNSLALGDRYPLLSSSPLEGEEKRWGVRKGRPCFLAKIPEALQNYLLLGYRKKW